MSYLLIEQSLKVSLYMQHATLKKEDHKFNCTTQLIPNFFFFVCFSLLNETVLRLREISGEDTFYKQILNLRM